MTAPQSPELDVARQAAAAGGEIVSRYFREGVAIRTKESYNLVSDADLESERAIVEVIRAACPGHAVLGEESHREDADSEHLWVIDPLDGTNNFAHGIPHFAVSLGYYHRGEPVCGVIYNPVRDDWFVALREEGAFYGDEPVRADETGNLTEVLVGVGFYYDRGAMMEATLAAIADLFRQKIHGIRRFGTASLDLCMVGMGRFGGFFEYELAPWDFAAGRLFVREAGGTITDCGGQPLALAKSSVLAAGPHLHSALLEVVRRHRPGK